MKLRNTVGLAVVAMVLSGCSITPVEQRAPFKVVEVNMLQSSFTRRYEIRCHVRVHTAQAASLIRTIAASIFTISTRPGITAPSRLISLLAQPWAMIKPF